MVLQRLLFFAALCFGLVFACRAPADAALHVCDRSPLPVSVALATISPTASGSVSQSQGWWQIDAGTCLTTIDADLQPGVQYFLYAKSILVTWQGSPKNGSRDVPFCNNAQNAFNYTDRTAALCNGANDSMKYFMYEPVQGPDWTINLDVPA